MQLDFRTIQVGIESGASEDFVQQTTNGEYIIQEIGFVFSERAESTISGFTRAGQTLAFYSRKSEVTDPNAEMSLGRVQTDLTGIRDRDFPGLGRFGLAILENQCAPVRVRSALLLRPIRFGFTL